MKKICSGCGEEKDTEHDFSWKDSKRGIRQTRCKLCQSQVSKRHYENNKQSYMRRIRAREPQRIEDNQRKLVKYLSEHPCVDCSSSDIRVLEFDHVRGKKAGNIANMLGDGYSWTNIEAEIAKCEVRCANCHRIQTNQRQGRWRHLFASQDM